MWFYEGSGEKHRQCSRLEHADSIKGSAKEYGYLR